MDEQSNASLHSPLSKRHRSFGNRVHPIDDSLHLYASEACFRDVSLSKERSDVWNCSRRPDLSIEVPNEPSPKACSTTLVVAEKIRASTAFTNSAPLNSVHTFGKIAHSADTVSDVVYVERRKLSFLVSPPTSEPFAGLHRASKEEAQCSILQNAAKTDQSQIISLWTLQFTDLDLLGKFQHVIMARSSGGHNHTSPHGHFETGRSEHATPRGAIGLDTAGQCMEKTFLSWYIRQYNRSNSFSVLIASIIWALFTLNDINYADRSNLTLLVTLRAMDCVFGVTMFFILRSKRWQGQPIALRNGREQLLFMLGMVTFGISQLFFGVWHDDILSPEYSMFLVLLCAMAPTLWHQRFIFTVVLSSVLISSFIILALTYGAYQSSNSLITTSCGILGSHLLFVLFAYRRELTVRRDFVAGRQLTIEEAKSEVMLSNMMPRSAVQKLRSGATYIYNRHETVTVLFSHICDFDGFTSRCPPEELVSFLNALFSSFDRLTDDLHVYKVETIGDVFLVCSNCPVEYERPDHAAIMCAMALKMLEVAKEFQCIEGEATQLKIGLHTGSVIAGVVGNKFPRFRLMGDTVNTASRMSTTSIKDVVQLSLSTLEALQPYQRFFDVKERGTIAVKGKGDMITHILVSSTYNIKQARDKMMPKSLMEDDASPRSSMVPVDDSLENAIKERAELIKGLGNRIMSTSPPYDETSLDNANVTNFSPSRHKSRFSVPADTFAKGSPDPCKQSSPRVFYQHTQSYLNPSAFPAGTPTLCPRAYSENLSLSHFIVPPEPGVDSLIIVAKPDDSLSNRASPPPLRWRSSNSSFTSSYTVHLPAACEDNSRQSSVNDNNALLPSPLNRASRRVPKEKTVVIVDDRTNSETTSTVNSASVVSSAHPNAPSESTAVSIDVSMARSEAQSRAPLKVITASRPVERLYNLGELSRILNPPGQTWKNRILQRFSANGDLEETFCSWYSEKELKSSRYWTRFIIGCFVVLCLYETFIGFNTLTRDVDIKSWYARSLGFAASFMYLIVTQWMQGLFLKHMQLITSVTLFFIGSSFAWSAIIFGEYQTSYGIGVLLILFAMVFMVVSLRFIFALTAILGIIIFYCITCWLITSSVPAVFLMVVAGAFIYAECSFVGESLVRQEYVRKMKREIEKTRTQQFLDNMLPAQVLSMLRSGHVVAKTYQSADVLFCDLVSFTTIAARIAPEDVVAALNVLFGTFDNLSNEHKVFKVETIGDCWMGCCGVVEESINHTQNLCEFALAMIRSTRNFRVQLKRREDTHISDRESEHHSNTGKIHTRKRTTASRMAGVLHRTVKSNELDSDVINKTEMESSVKQEETETSQLSVRVGIHTGCLVAGVVGKKCSRYHMFGNTVSVAEEIEHQGVPGQVSISEATRLALVSQTDLTTQRKFEIVYNAALVMPLSSSSESTNEQHNPIIAPSFGLMHTYLLKRVKSSCLPRGRSRDCSPTAIASRRTIGQNYPLSTVFNE